jgi:choline kinase
MLPTSTIDGESLGLMVFRNEGLSAFPAALNQAIRDPAALRQWYHDIINRMAASLRVETVLVKGLWWQEIDTPEDLTEARLHLASRRRAESSQLLSRL